jgi:hypothetical protein
MIGRCALGRAPLLAWRKGFAARDSFARGHRCAIPYIDDVNISFDRREGSLSLHCQHLLAQDKRTSRGCRAKRLGITPFCDGLAKFASV